MQLKTIDMLFWGVALGLLLIYFDPLMIIWEF